MKYPNFSEEKKLWRQGFKYVVGLDEAGRGPLAGPVVAAAVLLEPGKKFFLKGLNDCKKLSEKQRNHFYKILTSHKNIKWGIGIVSEKIIDEINILEATKLAMKKAIRQARGRLNYNIDYMLIDGNFGLDLKIPQKSIIAGDQKVVSIAAAGIIAKVSRDRIIKKMHKKYPQYMFDKHKGYPTKIHIKMLEKYGACPVHRKSFKPVSEIFAK